MATNKMETQTQQVQLQALPFPPPQTSCNQQYSNRIHSAATNFVNCVFDPYTPYTICKARLDRSINVSNNQLYFCRYGQYPYYYYYR